MNEIIVTLWLLFGIYVAVLLLIGADLWSGVRKARRRHEVRTSKGYRQTVHKVARYYNMLMALSVMDAMQMGGVWCLDAFYAHHIPLLPVVTLLGAIGIGCIEVRSIYEKAEQKERADYHDALSLLARMAAGAGWEHAAGVIGGVRDAGGFGKDNEGMEKDNREMKQNSEEMNMKSDGMGKNKMKGGTE